MVIYLILTYFALKDWHNLAYLTTVLWAVIAGVANSSGETSAGKQKTIFYGLFCFVFELVVLLPWVGWCLSL